MSYAPRTYREMQDEVLAFQFNELRYRDLVKRWLNDGQRKAFRESEIRTQEEREELVTEAGQKTLPLPSNFLRFIDLGDTETKRLLIPMETEEFDSAPESSGRPTAYLIINNSLIPYPFPDGPYTLALRFWRLPEDMEADGDIPELPAAYQDIPIAYAMQKAYARENDYQASAFWKGELEAMMLKMRGEVVYERFDGPKQVGGTWGDPHTPGRINVWK